MIGVMGRNPSYSGHGRYSDHFCVALQRIDQTRKEPYRILIKHPSAKTSSRTKQNMSKVLTFEPFYAVIFISVVVGLVAVVFMFFFLCTYCNYYYLRCANSIYTVLFLQLAL
jgi:hypothetical protein